MRVTTSACVWVLCLDDEVIDEAVAIGTPYSLVDYLEGRMQALPLKGLEIYTQDRLTGWGHSKAFDHRIAILRTANRKRFRDALSKLERLVSPEHLGEDSCELSRAAKVLQLIEARVGKAGGQEIFGSDKFQNALSALALSSCNEIHRRSVFVDCTSVALKSQVPSEEELDHLMRVRHRRLLLVPATLHF